MSYRVEIVRSDFRTWFPTALDPKFVTEGEAKQYALNIYRRPNVEGVQTVWTDEKATYYWDEMLGLTLLDNESKLLEAA